MRFAESLDRTKRRLTAFYRWLLIVVAIGFITFIGVAVWHSRGASGSQGEWFYLAVFVLLVLAWLGGQLLSLRPSRRTGLEIPPIRKRVRELDGGRVFELGVGDPPAASSDTQGVPGDGTDPELRTFTFSRSFGGRASLPSVLRAHTPDAAALDIAERYRMESRDWDYICDCVNPDYRSWDRMRQALYRRYVEALLDARRQQQPPAP